MLDRNLQDLIKPQRPFIEGDPRRQHVTTVVIEPLEKGFGLTLGNALRRILLSSLQGGAITSVRIEGVLHEFSCAPGVREDVTDIVQNLKGVAVKISADGTKRLRLHSEVCGPVRAGDIITPSDVEILNPEQIICHLDRGASVDMHLTACLGKGYVPADQNRPEEKIIGLIPIDSVHCPIKNVAYRVEGFCVGPNLEKDRLVLNVTTNGGIEAANAIGIAARIMQHQLDPFASIEPEARSSITGSRPFIYATKSVNDLELSPRAATVLRGLNIVYVSDLVAKTENELLRNPHVGRKVINELKEQLSALGLSLAD